MAISGSSTSSSSSWIELLDGVDDVALAVGGRPAGTPQVEDRVALGVEPDALEPAGQEAAVPLPRGDRLGLAEPARRGQDDEAGQVVALAAQAVGEPRAHRRPAGDGRAGVHEGVRRVVVDRLGHHRADDADVVGDRGQVREDRADLLAAGPQRWNGCWGAKQTSFWPWSWAIGMPLGERLGHRLAVHLGQVGLVVERLQVRRAAGHVQVDDPLGLGGEVERMDRAGPSVGACRDGERLRSAPRSRDGSSSEARARVPTPVVERPRNARRPMRVRMRRWSEVHGRDPCAWRQFRVMVSWRFRSTRATEVQAASSAGSMSGGCRGIADAQQLRGPRRGRR